MSMLIECAQLCIEPQIRTQTHRSLQSPVRVRLVLSHPSFCACVQNVEVSERRFQVFTCKNGAPKTYKYGLLEPVVLCVMQCSVAKVV